jgi:aryl-alcohol dehydrogenase-like predicted oxidoreductase
MKVSIMLTSYRALGRSGLIVSPMALGTMTFGTARWGSAADDARAVFNAYTELGGNFVDTADVYAGGGSEAMVGAFIAERGLRDQIVLATKAGFATGRPLAGGNGAKHIIASVNASLTRLKTDYIDLFWLHVWDGVTPAEELLETMANLIRAGKIRYWGLSNTPAWLVAQLVTLARAQGMPAPIALQYFYALVNREVEDEHVPLAQALGLGIVPWSPLGYGLLTGKYDRSTVAAKGALASGLPRDAGDGAIRADGDKRLDGANPFGDTLFTDRNWAIVDVLKRVADEAGETPARVALAWVMGRRGVTSTLMGVSRPSQVADNAGALGVVLSADHQAALDTVSAGQVRMVTALAQPMMRKNAVFGAQVQGWGD